MLTELQPVVAKLQGERAKLIGVINAVPEARRSETVYAEGWTLFELVSHLAAAEKENVRYVREVLRQDGALHVPPSTTAVDLDSWNAEAVAKRDGSTWDARMAEFAEARRITLQTVESIRPEQLAHRGVHLIWGEKSVEGLLKLLYLHDIMHRNDIARRFKAQSG